MVYSSQFSQFVEYGRSEKSLNQHIRDVYNRARHVLSSRVSPGGLQITDVHVTSHQDAAGLFQGWENPPSRECPFTVVLEFSAFSEAVRPLAILPQTEFMESHKMLF